jgi:hypothetical protein
MGKSSKITIGYRYYMGLHMGLNYGEVDEITHIEIGGREAWQGSITSNTTITIDKPDLFGGDESEGGIQGTLDVMFGAPDQPVNSKIAAMLGRAVSAYRKRTTLFFDGMVCALSKVPKQWAIRRNRRLKGWDGGVWYPEKAAINLPGGIKAMNGAHIIYEALTNRDWGDKKPRAKLDDAAFRTAADICYTEGLGLCMEYFKQSPIKQFIDEVQSHIGANVFQSRTTGLWTIRLVRAPADINALTLFTPTTGLLGIDDDDNAAPVVAVNEIIVIYTDPLRKKDVSIRVPNAAGNRGAGGAISETVTYSGIPTAELAARLGQRDLRAKYSAKKFKVRLDRRGYKIEPGGLFRISDPARGIANLVLRAGKIDDGTIDNGVIRIDAVLDVFGLPANSWMKPQPPRYVPPNLNPLPVVMRTVSEATYRDLARSLDDSTLQAITPGTNFITTVASAPSGFSLGYRLDTRVSPGDWRSFDCEFCPTAIATNEIVLGASAVTVALENAIGLDVVEVGSACLIDNEILRVDAVNMTAQTVTLARGCVDTVPAYHAPGARVWFYEDYLGDVLIELSSYVDELEQRMVAAGSLADGAHYRVNAQAASSLLASGALSIDAQYTSARADGVPRVIIMDGGATDVLNDDCAGMLTPDCPAARAAVRGAEQLYQRFATDGVEQLVHFFYGDPVDNPSLKDGIDLLRPLLRNACGRSPVPCHWLDLRPTFAEHPEYVGADGFVFSDAGAAAAAQSTFELLQARCIAN